MNLTTLTLDQFLCTGSSTDAASDPNAFQFSASTAAMCLGAKIRDLGEGYALHHLTTAPGDVALTFNNNVVGFYLTEVLAVDPAHAGQRLSVPMILAAVTARPLPATRTLSSEGKSALTYAWNVANRHAADPWP